MKLTLQEEIWQWVASIPSGKVATYGQIAKLAGHPRHARYVGATLKRLPKESALPWHRVLRSSGELAFAAGSAEFKRQQESLLCEGIGLTDTRVNLGLHQWHPLQD